MSILFSLFFSLTLNASPRVDALIQKADEFKLHERKEWIRLGHYHKNLFGKYKSQADGDKFFIAPDGKTNPKSELESTLRAFFTDSNRFCQFPARWKWLSTQLDIKNEEVVKSDCVDYKTFRDKVSAKSVTLVFSSYYLNNPASAFGHSLIRLNKTEHAQKGERFELLDYGFNFAANPNTSNPILYAVGGIIGTFEGVFTNIPYYYKVREYNDAESRDLWEYDLDLTPSEVEYLVAHIWELGSTNFDYFYLSENCSYHMLTTLEVAATRFELLNKLHSWIIPADTIRAVYETPNMVRKVQYRPAARTEFYYRIKDFDKKKLDVVEELIAHQESKDETAETLDAAIEYLDYKYAKEIYLKQEPFAGQKQKLLVKRSRLEGNTRMHLEPDPLDQPHTGHTSARSGLSYLQSQNEGSGLEFSMRYALHDLLDPIQGYPRYAKIEFFNFRFRSWFDHRDFKLEEWSLFAVESVSPWSRFESPLSYSMKVGSERIYDKRCHQKDCLTGVVEAGPGFAVNAMSKSRSLTPFLFLMQSTNFGDLRGAAFSYSLGPDLGLRWTLAPNLLFLSRASWRKTFHKSSIESSKLATNLRWSPVENWSLDSLIEWNKLGREVKVGFYYYF